MLGIVVFYGVVCSNTHTQVSTQGYVFKARMSENNLDFLEKAEGPLPSTLRGRCA